MMKEALIAGIPIKRRGDGCGQQTSVCALRIVKLKFDVLCGTDNKLQFVAPAIVKLKFDVL